MKDNLSLDETKHVADLVNLRLSPDEVEKLSIILSDTLDYIDVLNELDTANVPETFQVTGLTNVFIERSKHEVSTQSLKQGEALENAPQVQGGKIVTEAVFDR